MPRKDPEARRAYQREYQRQWYRKNRAVHLERVTRVNRRAREALQRYLDDVKAQPCTDCGGRFPPCVMDFDHVRGEKVANLSRFRTGRLAWAKLQEELAKCEVVCANCHRLRTHLGRRGEDEPSLIDERWFREGYVSVVI